VGIDGEQLDQRLVLRVGTRASKLALAQTAMVHQQLLQALDDVEVEVVHISTRGDRVQDRPLAAIGGKALFVEEIETALRERRIHLAVHSAKDIPSDLPVDMRIAACLPRADARDVMVSHAAPNVMTLPAGSRVGTSSPRRACQLRALRSDLDIQDIRGNVDTRLAKLDRGDYDAIILAAAGLARLGLSHRVTQFLPVQQFLPSAAQGCIAVEVLASDPTTVRIVAQLNHVATGIAVSAERAFASTVGGSCETPLAAFAEVDDEHLSLSAMIGDATGRMVSGTIAGSINDPIALGHTLASQLLANGGGELLRGTVHHPAA
jgi:hydroxymethylbilane synthase